MRPSDKARRLSRGLIALELRPIAASRLARVTGGGETASTSTSGTPEAGDDTVGDSSGGGGLSAGKVHFSDLTISMK